MAAGPARSVKASTASATSSSAPHPSGWGRLRAPATASITGSTAGGTVSGGSSGSHRHSSRHSAATVPPRRPEPAPRPGCLRRPEAVVDGHNSARPQSVRARPPGPANRARRRSGQFVPVFPVSTAPDEWPIRPDRPGSVPWSAHAPSRPPGRGRGRHPVGGRRPARPAGRTRSRRWWWPWPGRPSPPPSCAPSPAGCARRPGRRAAATSTPPARRSSASPTRASTSSPGRLQDDDRAAAAALLEAKQKVEADFTTPPAGAQVAADLRRLAELTRSSLARFKVRRRLLPRLRMTPR